MAQFDQQQQLSGLAGEIRSALTSEQFDLGGYTEQRARDLMLSSFSSPLTAPRDMLKFTFVVGGGKLVRSRYSDDLPKWLIGALREVGFSEDRSAAETLDSQGTFKQQHDTGQNLKYLVVFPRLACGNASSSSSSSAGGKKAEEEAMLDDKSPEYIVMACEKSTLLDIVDSKVSSYHQKKKLLKILQEKSEEFKAIEAKLVSAAMLTPREQAFYDANSGSDDEKILWLQNAIKAMIDEGHLTAREKAELLKQMQGNISALTAEIDAAKAEGKPKKAEKAEAKREAVLSRKTAVEKISPIPPRLKNGDQIRKLYMRVYPLQALEDKGRSMSLTLADLKLLEEKIDIEAEIKVLEQTSRGWFEDEEDFVERCQYEEKEAKAAFKARKNDPKKSSSGGSKSTSTGKSSSASSAGAWSSVGKKPSGLSSSVAKPAAKKQSSAFAAAFDSDSD